MRGHVLRTSAAIFTTMFLLGAVAHAQESDISLSVGYAHAYGTSNQLFHDKDGAYVDGDFAWKLPVEPVPVSIGFGLTGSGYFDSRDLGGYSNGYGYGYYDNNAYSDVGFFEFEPRVSMTFWSTLLRGVFVKPRFGLGVLIDNYAIDEVNNNDGYIDTHYHTGAAFEIRPAVQVGYTWGFGSAGIEGSYMPAWGDFGRLGSSIQELRVGGFFTVRF